MECDNCIYRARASWYGCDYIEKTGRSKIKAIYRIEMETGNKPQMCPVKNTKCQKIKPRFDRAGYQVKVRPPNPVSVDAVRKMAKRGMSDREIAAEFGVTRETIRGVRWRNQIPAGIPPTGGRTRRGSISG